MKATRRASLFGWSLARVGTLGKRRRSRNALEMSTEIKGVRKMRPRSAAEPDVSTPFRHDTQAGRVAPACSAHGAQRAHAPTGEQLVECERALLHCAELQQQRAQHVSRLTKLAEDSRLRKQVSVHECVDLACANVLAKRNGYGLALVFLAAGATPEENVRQLTNYFFALQAALLRASQPERRQLGQCADLAAHYLFKTPWFARAPLRPFVMLGNLLSKYPDHPACLQALSWIADQVLAPAQMPALGEKDLALLANALSKNSGCGRSEQAVARIGRHVVRAGAGDFRAQSVSLMLNACSKWSGNADCRDAVEVLAARVSEDAALQRDMAAQAVANALNALSKWPERIGCRNAVLALAVRVAADVALRCRMKPQEVANALNALSKWPERIECRNAVLSLATHVGEHGTLRQAMNAQHVANALNALSKWPEQGECCDAALPLIRRVADDAALRSSMDALVTSNVLNALSKWPDRVECRDTAVTLALRVAADAGLRHDMGVQAVANALNALSKWSEQAGCRDAALSLAARMVGDASLRHAMSAQNVANTLSALSKWPEQAGCRDAVLSLAARVADDAALRLDMNAQNVANVLNALSKWPERGECRDAMLSLASRVADDAALRYDMSAQAAANALNALSKWPAQTGCRDAALRLAARVAEDAALRHSMDAQQVANTLNALSKWPEASSCRQVTLLLMRSLGESGCPWRQFNMINLAQIANASARLFLSASDEVEIQALARTKLRALAAHLGLHRERFETASASSIGTIFKAMEALQLPAEMRSLVCAAMNRIERLCSQASLRSESRESLGMLRAGLLPYIDTNRGLSDSPGMLEAAAPRLKAWAARHRLEIDL
ncbi:hypothetical protein [Ralstonia pseudosolanacearum]|nr:hypothetical protein [Ralstonia pseudosolanacearum]NJZ67404.1 RipS6-effector family protein [Ralstonia solanacearum]NJZ76833.1 RipS6-effector family protein [Ralstonia solanacearum]NJZ81137.1 RipS6-effector family protein [Ralstonia solanacearum]NKA12424.1 RipS6-effector family protein [Ralstonia solanacearum]NKA33265.1 RipS6-effector family protein [Ralstonia solanacearum]